MTIKRITFLQELLCFVGLKERLYLSWISSAEAGKFVEVVSEFTRKIKEMGPNPVKGYDLKLWLDSLVPPEREEKPGWRFVTAEASAGR